MVRIKSSDGKVSIHADDGSTVSDIWVDGKQVVGHPHGGERPMAFPGSPFDRDRDFVRERSLAKKGIGCALFLILFEVVAIPAVFGAICYVAWHFISKYW